MKLLKVTVLLILAFFLVIGIDYLQTTSQTSYFDDIDFDAKYNIVFDTNNTNISLLSTTKEDIEIIQDSSKIRDTLSDMFYYIDDDTITFKTKNSEAATGNTQDNVIIFIPSNLLVGDISYHGLNNNFTVDSQSFENINIGGNNLNVIITNSNFYELTSSSENMNISLSDTNFQNFDYSALTSTVKFENVVVDGDIDLRFNSKGNVVAESFVANNFNINGNVDLNLALSLTQNYEIKTEIDINNNNLTATSSGYKYTGDSAKENVSLINLEDAIVNDIEFVIK